MNFNEKFFASVSGCLENLLKGNFVQIETAGLEEKEFKICLQLNKLSEMLKELFTFSEALSHGNLDVKVPERKNYLASGLKSIHSQLMHVNWQAKQITEGDYRQRIDFMGEFSETFNWMIETLQKRENELKKIRDMLLNIFNTINSVIILLDPETNDVLFLNKTAKQIFNIESAYEDKNAGRENEFLSYIKNLKLNDNEHAEYFNEKENAYYLITCTKAQWEDDKTLNLVNCVDITFEKQKELSLRKAACFDFLTGALNRFSGLLRIEELMAALDYHRYICFCFIDLDNLKKINDTFGHNAGDKVLIQMAESIKATIRGSDLLIRMGGDEFLAVFPSIRIKALNGIIIPRLNSSVDNFNVISGLPYKLEFSYGTFEIMENNQLTINEIIEKADEEMYIVKKAKKVGRD